MTGIIRGLASEISVQGKAKIFLGMNKNTTVTFIAKYKKLSKDEAQAKIDAVNNPDSDTTPETVIREDLIGWSKFDGDGGEVEFNDENLDAVLASIEYSAAFFEAWGQAQLGTQLAAAKN